MFSEILRLAPRYLIAAAILAACLLFSPESLLQKLGVSEFANANRSWLGPTFIGTIALFAVSCVANTVRWVRSRHRRRKAHENVKERLHHLAEDEKQT